MPAIPRVAQAADAAALATLDESVNPSPWGLRRFEGACSGSGGLRESVLLIEDANRPVAYIVISRVLDEASIHNVGVSEGCRRRGLAGVLVDAALALLAEQGVVRCLLEVRASNHVARTLYHSREFTVDGIRENYYPDGAGREDALLMSRVL